MLFLFNLSAQKCELDHLMSSKTRRRTQKHELVGTVTLSCKYLTDKRPVCWEGWFLLLFIGKCLAPSNAEQIHAIGDEQYYSHILRPVQSETFCRAAFPSFHFPITSRLLPGSMKEFLAVCSLSPLGVNQPDRLRKSCLEWLFLRQLPKLLYCLYVLVLKICRQVAYSFMPPVQITETVLHAPQKGFFKYLIYLNLFLVTKDETMHRAISERDWTVSD